MNHIFAPCAVSYPANGQRALRTLLVLSLLAPFGALQSAEAEQASSSDSLEQAAPAPQYRITLLPEDFFPSLLSEAINSRGEVVGSIPSSEGPSHAAVYTRGHVVDLGTLGGSFSDADGINDRGDVVGRSTLPPNEAGDAALHAFLYANGVMEDLGTLLDFSSATGVNNKQVVVGNDSTEGGGTQGAFRYEDGVFEHLPTLGGFQVAAHGINERGQIVGFSSVDGETQILAVIWRRGQIKPLATIGDGTFSIGRAINDRGDVTGIAGPAANETRPFLYSKGVMHDLGDIAPGAIQNTTGINNRGDITAEALDPSTGQWLGVFLYRDGTWYNLADLISPQDPLKPYFAFERAGAINNRGEIVVLGRDSRDGGVRGVVLRPQ